MPAASLADRIATFIDTATVKHAGKYDYSAVHLDFVNAHTKVTIGCPDHGEFMQTPNDHRRGQRCPDCSGRRGSSPEARRTQFVDRARSVHGDRYNYNDVEYIDQHASVVIICRAHGPFSQRPTNHLDADGPSGCHRCAMDARRRIAFFNRMQQAERALQLKRKNNGRFKKPKAAKRSAPSSDDSSAAA